MNFAAKLSIVAAMTVPLLLLGYSIFSAPAFGEQGAAPAAAPRAGVGQSQLVSAESLDAGLMTAVGVGDINRVQEFLNRGANANARNAQGLSAIAAAAYTGNSEIVGVLLNHGARDNDGSALTYAQAGGHTDVAQLLGQSGVAPTGAPMGAMHGASQAGLKAVVTSVDRPENCLRIRNAPGRSHQMVGCAARGEVLTLTGVVQTGWAQVGSPVQGWVLGRQIRAEGLFPAKAAAAGRRSSGSSTDDAEFFEFPESEEYVVTEPDYYYYQGPESGYYVQPGPRAAVSPRGLLRSGFSAAVGPLRLGVAPPPLPRPLP